jgi:hypothetical protein
MKKRYFTVNETEGECTHVGTLVASTSEELKKKLITACMGHFDANVIKTSDIDIEDCIYGKIYSLKITLDCMMETTNSVSISETWLY